MASVAVAPSPSFGALLKRYRRAAGLTQEALAERAGYSVGHISKLESSVRQPVSATVELLGDALDLSAAERGALGRAARRAPTPTPAAPCVNAQALPPLIGRGHEVKRLERHLVAEAEPPLRLFAGEPGIGKTRLLQEATRRGASEGWCILEGTCRRHGAQGPYGALLEAIVGAIRRIEHDQLRSALDGCSWLVRLVPELAELGAVPLPTWSLPADHERRLMFSAVERFLSNIAGPAGTLLVLDNMQWAGADALDLLSTLVAAAPQSPLRIVGAYRHNEVHPGNPLVVLLADLAHEGLVVQEMVGPLASRAAAELLDVLLAGDEHVNGRTRAEVLRKAAGVPFVLVSYAHWLRSRAAQEGNSHSDLGIPWDVAQTVRQRMAALPEAAQAVVHIAAVAEGDDARELLTGVAERLGYTEIEAVTAIDAACEAGLLVPRDDDLYAFAYDLTREVIERSLGAAQHAYLHRVIAEVMEGERTRHQVGAVADHFLRAGEPERALTYLERAGAQARALHAYADAERYYRAVAEQMDACGQVREASHAREHQGTILGSMGRYAEALEQLETALDGYRAIGWPDGRVRVAAQIGTVYYAQGEIDRGIARLEQELALAADASEQALASLYMALAQLYSAGGLYERELDAAEHAAQLARRGNDRHLLALAEVERGTALGMLDRLDEGLRALEDVAVPLTEEAGDPWTQALALDRAAQSHLLRGEFSEAQMAIERGMALGWQVDDEVVSGLMTLNRGIVRYYMGAWRQAQADLRWARVMLQRRRVPSRVARAVAWLGQMSLAKGRWERAEYELSQGLVLAELSGDAQPALLAHCALAERELLLGKPEQARMRLEPLLADAAYQMSDLTGVLALLGWAGAEVGDERQSEALVAASVMRASATGLRCALVDALRIQALAASHGGRRPDALAGVAEALALARKLSYPYAEAKALYASGLLLLRRGEVEDGREQLAAAHTILTQLGERLYADDIDRLGATGVQTGAWQR